MMVLLFLKAGVELPPQSFFFSFLDFLIPLKENNSDETADEVDYLLKPIYSFCCGDLSGA